MWLAKLLPAASIFSINPSVHGVGRRFSEWESLLCQCEEQNSNPQKPRKARCDSIYLQSQCSYGEVDGRDGSALKVSCIGVGSSKQETLSQTRRKIPNAIQVCPLTFTDKLWHTVHIVTQEHIHTKKPQKHTDRMISFPVDNSKQQENGNNFTPYCNPCKTHDMM